MKQVQNKTIESKEGDVTLEGSLMNGFVQGPGAVRAIVTCIRKIYERQEFSFAGPFGEHVFFENYTGWVQVESIDCTVMIIRNAAGQAQHIAVNYRPLNMVLLLSRLAGEYFTGTPYSEDLTLLFIDPDQKPATGSKLNI